jgi:hypothetical protein
MVAVPVVLLLSWLSSPIRLLARTRHRKSSNYCRAWTQQQQQRSSQAPVHMLPLLMCRCTMTAMVCHGLSLQHAVCNYCCGPCLPDPSRLVASGLCICGHSRCSKSKGPPGLFSPISIPEGIGSFNACICFEGSKQAAQNGCLFSITGRYRAFSRRANTITPQ